MEVQLKTMFSLQQEMNTLVDKDWKSKNYNFHRAAWVECAEIMDHCGYKWWKKPNVNIDQVQMEVVDIWHFILSIYLTTYGEQIFEKIDSFVKALDIFTYNNDNIMDNTERTAISLLLFDDDTLFSNFLQLMVSTGMSFNLLFKKYTGKNILNKFRQNNGYKDGTYRKIWNGFEDNEHLTEIISYLNIESDTFCEDLYERLETRYML